MSWRALIGLFRIPTGAYVCACGRTQHSMSNREYRRWQRTGVLPCRKCGGTMLRLDVYPSEGLR